MSARPRAVELEKSMRELDLLVGELERAATRASPATTASPMLSPPSDAQIEEQGRLAAKAERWADEVVPQLDPSTPKETIDLAKRTITNLMKKESFEENLLRHSPEIVGTIPKEKKRVRFSDDAPKGADRPVAVKPIPTILRPTEKKKKGGKTAGK